MQPSEQDIASWVTGLTLVILGLSGLLAAVCLKRTGIPLTADFLLACASPFALLGFAALLLYALAVLSQKLEHT